MTRQHAHRNGRPAITCSGAKINICDFLESEREFEPGPPTCLNHPSESKFPIEFTFLNKVGQLTQIQKGQKYVSAMKHQCGDQLKSGLHVNSHFSIQHVNSSNRYKLLITLQTLAVLHKQDYKNCTLINMWLDLNC